ncbi:Ubiquitin carboxyl-terminal hydrolase 34 [Homalodisca vitripennis]|nr:Ubiquitin carboxyl-terminal hydrolase 34 [Homalodisca vitripennis]
MLKVIGDEENTNESPWSEMFVQNGGLRHLFDIFMSGVLQVPGGSEWQQDCLACLLKLLCQLGMTHTTDDSATNKNKRKRCTKSDKMVIPKLSQPMVQLMNIETVIPRLTSILYEASMPRDPNHYKTGFWGRAQVVQYAMALIVSWAYTVSGVREALYAEEQFHTWLRRLVLEEPEPCVRREVCMALYRLAAPPHAPSMLTHLLGLLDKAEVMRPAKQEGLHLQAVPEDGKEPYGPACRDYFWLLCRLVDSLTADDISKEVVDLENLASRVYRSILQREYLETRHNTVEDDGLIGLLNLMSNILKHNPSFKTGKEGQALLNEVFEFLFALPDPSNRHFPKCKSQAARSSAYDLLVELVKGARQNYKQLHEKLLAQHKPGPHSPYPWDYWPHEDGRSDCGYVGLTNLGATCYMASCMQHLYMMPQARAEILRAQVDTASSKHQLTLRELQRMFAYLLELNMFAAGGNSGYCCYAALGAGDNCGYHRAFHSSYHNDVFLTPREVLFPHFYGLRCSLVRAVTRVTSWQGRLSSETSGNHSYRLPKMLSHFSHNLSLSRRKLTYKESQYFNNLPENRIQERLKVVSHRGHTVFYKISVSIDLNGVIHTDLTDVNRRICGIAPRAIFSKHLLTSVALRMRTGSLPRRAHDQTVAQFRAVTLYKKTRPLLWNTDLEEYRASNLKDTAWGEIAEQLEQNSKHMSSSSLFELLSPSSNQGTFLVNVLSHHEPLAMLPASTKPTDRAETMSQYLTDVGGGVNCTSVTRHLSHFNCHTLLSSAKQLLTQQTGSCNIIHIGL